MVAGIAAGSRVTPGSIGQPGRSVGEVGDRRDDVRRLAGEGRVPELLLVPWAASYTAIRMN